MLKFQEKLQKANEIAEILHAMGEGSIFINLNEGEQDSVDISYFVPEKAKLGVFLYVKSICGRLDKGTDGYMKGSCGNVNIGLFGILTCKQVGTKIVEEPVMVATGEVKQVEKPVYECLTPLAVEA